MGRGLRRNRARRERGLQRIRSIQRVALGGQKACIDNDAAEFFFVGAAFYARGKHHIFFNQNAANVVGAELQANLANLDPGREPTRLDVIDIVRDRAG